MCYTCYIFMYIRLLTTDYKMRIGTVNSLPVTWVMLAGINICVFEAKPCSLGVMFVVSSGLVNYLGPSYFKEVELYLPAYFSVII